MTTNIMSRRRYRDASIVNAQFGHNLLIIFSFNF